MLIDPCFIGYAPTDQWEAAEWFRLANQLVNRGITHILMAPNHPLDAQFPVQMDEWVLTLQTLLDRRGIPLRVYGSQLIPSEYSHFAYDAQHLLFADLNQRYVLVSMAESMDFEAIHPTLFALLKQDIRPVLVQPERAGTIDSTILTTLLEQGCYVLVSSQSVMGLNGPDAKKWAWQALAQGQVHLIGTVSENGDVDHFPDALAVIRQRLGRNYHDDLLLNAKALLNGDPLITQFQLTSARWRWPFSKR
ncbi:MAG: hypothetical protein Q4A67_05410 [Aerococcus sp.]|nr:hypothetical protein [Aerococcus sp.]